jgi:hypothetical protein
MTPDVNADKHPGLVRRERPQGTKKARRGTEDPDAATAESLSRSMEGAVSVLHQRNELERERLLYEKSRDERSLLRADIDVFQASHSDQVTLSREDQDCRADALQVMRRRFRSSLTGEESLTGRNSSTVSGRGQKRSGGDGQDNQGKSDIESIPIRSSASSPLAANPDPTEPRHSSSPDSRFEDR